MKQLKKLAALVLAVTMAATAAVPAWAEGEENKNNGGTQSGSTAATELDNSGTIYISSYNVIYEDPNVSPILKFKDGELKNQAVAKTVTLKVVDTRGIPTTEDKEDKKSPPFVSLSRSASMCFFTINFTNGAIG